MAVNTLWLDDKYANMLSFQLDRFKRLKAYTYNFRCPICGDSEKNKFKARGYLYKNKDHLSFKCHNCGASPRFSVLLKQINPELYKEYRIESIKETQIVCEYVPQIEKFAKPKHLEFEPLKNLKRISQLDADNVVKKYVCDRQIPNEYHHKIFYVTRFMEWINTFIPNKFSNEQLKKDEPRLVIPFIDENGYVFAVTGRSFKKNSLRYLTIKFDEDAQKIYGLEKLDRTKRIYILEGPIDSMFIPNSVAMAGADLDIRNLFTNNDVTIVFDNEPRNLEIVKRMEKFIDRGHNVCIWPQHILEKDINDMIITGKTSNEIISLIDENTYYGLKAKLKLAEWRKI